MVMMATKGPIVTMIDGSVGGDEGLIRTRAVLPAARLSRPRRMAVTGVSALLIGALSVGLATAAQAAHAGSAAPGRYVSKVAVLPGQSLWSLAEAYDPNADSRLIVREIQQLNSMAGDQVQAGQVLWVPRG
jgi:LysM domain